jgi:hypothetical protein
MPIYEQTPVRLDATLAGASPGQAVDQNTGSAPALWRGSSVAVQVGVFDADGIPIDLSNLAFLKLLLFKTPDDLVALFEKTLTADYIGAVSSVGWAAGTEQNATFSLSPSDTDQSLGGGAFSDFWLVLEGITTSGNVIIYSAGPASINNAGLALPASNMTTPSQHAQTNYAGNSSVVPSSNLHTEIVSIGGSARTSKIIVTQTGLSPGARVDVLVVRGSAVPSIVLELRLVTASGAKPFQFDTTTDAATRFSFYFDGSNLQPLEAVKLDASLISTGTGGGAGGGADFEPAFVELTGGAAALDQQTATLADAANGRILQGTVGGALAAYQVRGGTDATQSPGIIRPLNYNAGSNAVVFVQL